MSAQIGQLDPATAQARLRPWPRRAAPIPAHEYGQRIERARALMRAHGVDALLIGAGASLRYFTGVPWRASERLVAMLLTAAGEPLLICPAFEEGSLDAVLALDAGKRLWEEHEDPYARVAQAMAERGARTLALDPGAAFAVHGGLRAHLDAAAIVDAGAIVDGCRMCKSAAELALIQQACDMTLEVQRLAAGIAREGIGSDELARFIDQAHRALGADDGSTFCIVQFGHATAYPHGLPGVQHLREGDLVLIDTGCTVHGYHSDITRTWIYGRPGDEQRRIWALERAAQAAAFDAVRPGVACEDVDAAARRVLEAAGLGPGYRLPGLPHRTGHGCGLAIHEAPYLVRGNRTALQPGMCASDEPMIVVPGRFGVRLEDHFHVTADGAQWFTPPAEAIDRPFA
ncbi:M24 family metallopeptidase [Pseudoxanthomonas mexicana]|uniref:M24 family metallopeptidase n=1 Tax=Pseudoxanthomonas mexicana TaxID=128785 RepID=UPI00398AFC1E